MMLEIALDADSDWDSRGAPGTELAGQDWAGLARSAAEAAIAESAFPQLANDTRAIELSLRLTGDEAVRALNAEWRGKDRATNVLSFPMVKPSELESAGSQGGPGLLLGDVVLARGVCAAEAGEKGISLAHHAAHLIVHGTLHLLGYDHLDEPGAGDMEAREVRALARLGIADPYSGDR